MAQAVAKTLGVLLTVYLGYLLLLFLTQRQMLFPRAMIPTPGSRPSIEGMEVLWFPVGGDRVEAWYLPVEGATAERPVPAVIFTHGNGELIDFWALDFKLLTRDGVGVLLVEFPGYGRSGGTPSQESITTVMTAAFDHLAGRPEVAADRIVLLGRSLGGGAACSLAARRKPAALVLMSTFTSARAMARRYLAPPFLVRDPFDNLGVVRDFGGPVLIVHGRHDEVIPYRHGSALLRAAVRGRMISYACGHNDCPPHWGRFVKELVDWLESGGLLKTDRPPAAGPAGGPGRHGKG